MPHASESPEAIIGFNSDISFRNVDYHVQTENMADDASPQINTLIFVHGALIRKITSSSEDPDSSGQDLAERVKRQHQTALSQIKKGVFATKRG